jgi:CheY-like chemotaxis protein
MAVIIGHDSPMANTIDILLVEDDREHLKLTTYLLKKKKVPGEVHVVRDGQEAIDYLLHRNKFADPHVSPRPSVVLLDLNIPRVDGKQVLRMMKADKNLRDIPVVIVSSSNRQEDIAFASSAGAAGYISKSSGFEKLGEALAHIHTLAPRKIP